MKLMLLSALLIEVALIPNLALSQPSKLEIDSELQRAEWETFKAAHMKSYASAEEEARRRTIFFENLKFISDHNERYKHEEVTFHVAVNKYADLTNKEFTSMMNGYTRPLRRTAGISFNATETADLASTVDWREKGAVTTVKDQGHCGACYAFSATGALEGQTFIALNKLVSLSEQNLLDCSQVVGNNGCGGGTMDASFNYVKINQGIDTEASYSFEGVVGDCRYEMADIGAKASGSVDIRSGSEEDLQEAVAKIGPVSVALDASLDSFRFYKGGVYKESKCSSSRLDHAALAVGYSRSTLKGEYWIVKNSWGEDWGEKGYIRIAKNHDNMCGIATVASYPIIPYSHYA